MLAGAALAGCATYHSLPLPARPDLTPAGASAASRASVLVPANLGLEEAGTLAVARDPELRAARAQVRIARAQAYDAGLLPDPSLALGLQHPFNGGAPSDHHNAWDAGLTESLVGLITHSDMHAAASAQYAESLLAWRWQAEQVALTARVTYLSVWSGSREVLALRREAAAADRVVAAADKAYGAGALSAALYQQAVQQSVTIHARLNAAEDALVQDRSSLATLLRVQDGHAWRLETPPEPAAPSASAVQAALARLPQQRLDLLALQAGYRSADARLRADILAQFPIVDVGFTRSRDNTGVNSVGLGITINLPIFNGNRGRIAVDRATRAALNAAYQARLDTAANDVRATAERLELARTQLADAASRLPALEASAAASRKASANGSMNRFDAFTALAAALDARISTDQLRAGVAALSLTLQTLLALPAQQPSQSVSGSTT